MAEKQAWVLRLKQKVANEHYKGKQLYLNDDPSTDYLTSDLQEATIIDDVDEKIKELKEHEENIVEQFGEDGLCNFGWTNISQNFEFAEVMLIYPKGADLEGKS